MHNKCWVQGHLSVLITFLVLKRVDQEKQVTPKVEKFMKIQGIFKWYSLMQARIKKKKQAKHQQDSALDHK